MDHPENLHSVRTWAVKYKHPFEAGHSKNAQRFDTGGVQATMPSHFRLCGEERKCLVGSEEKPVADLGARMCGKVKGLVVEVLVGFGANDVACAHRVLFRRSSNRRCLLSQ